MIFKKFNSNIIVFITCNNIPKKSPQKAYYLRVRQNINEPEEKPILIEKKKKLLNRLNEIKDEEIPSKLDQYRSVEDGNIITYDNNNNEISTQEQNAIISETSSYNSNATSRFSRFTNYTFMSCSRIGNNIVNASSNHQHVRNLPNILFCFL